MRRGIFVIWGLGGNDNLSQTHIYSSLRSWVKKCLEQIPPPLPPPSSLHPSLIPFENLYQFNNLYFRSLYFVFSKCIFFCRPRPSSDWWWTRYTSRRWLPLDGWCLLHRKILNLTSAIKYDSIFLEGCSQLCFYLVLQNCLDFLSQTKSQVINRKMAKENLMWYPASPGSLWRVVNHRWWEWF